LHRRGLSLDPDPFRCPPSNFPYTHYSKGKIDLLRQKTDFKERLLSELQQAAEVRPQVQNKKQTSRRDFFQNYNKLPRSDPKYTQGCQIFPKPHDYSDVNLQKFLFGLPLVQKEE
jgi:hypothetical protein